MRVLVIDPPAYTPPYDSELCGALAARGHAVELATARFTHGSVPPAVGYRRSYPFGPPGASLLARRPGTPLRVPLKLAGHVAGLATLLQRVRRDRPDVVHWQWAPVPGLDLRALRALHRHAGATVFTAHDVLPRRSAKQVALWRELYGACDRVIVHSQGGRARLVDEVGVDPERVRVVPHALFASLAALPLSGPPTGDAATVLFFGLLRPDKGLDTLIEALPRLAERVPSARLEIVGSPRMAIEPLRQRAAALGVEGRIAWDLRFVDDAELAAAFRRARAVALPYREIEGSGVLATALAFGVPPVATAVGGFPELLAAYDLGEPVAPDDPAGLADALAATLLDDERRRRAADGMARARAELSWPHAAQLTEAVYAEALAER